MPTLALRQILPARTPTTASGRHSPADFGWAQRLSRGRCLRAARYRQNVAKLMASAPAYHCPVFGHPAGLFERPRTRRNPSFRLPAPSKKTPQKPSALWRCARLLRLLPLIGEQGSKLAVLFTPLLLGLIQPLPQVLDLVR